MKHDLFFANGTVSGVRRAPASYRMEVGLLSKAAERMGVKAARETRREGDPVGSAGGIHPAKAGAATSAPRTAVGSAGEGSRAAAGGVRAWWRAKSQGARPRMSLADVRVVRNDLRGADLEILKPGRLAMVRAWLRRRVATAWALVNR